MNRGLELSVGIREGDILAGKYRVERLLGAGGMGVVVAARHIQRDEKVALKFLLLEALHNSEAVARFAREARAAGKIKNEHVARVTDVGTLPNGAPYMVMEYLEGRDLAAWLKQGGALPIEQAVEFVLQACIAVADAHTLGIVHRDLKPGNLFCVRRSDGQLSVKVLDFGISKMADAGASGSATRTSALMGSPLYMSPEQMRSSKDVDAQTDIWALGVILFELMAGRPAFLGESVTELAIKVANEPTPPVRRFRPDVPSGLEAIIFKCLEKDRRQRYRNVAELALALLECGPKRAKGSVERITGIFQAAGLSASTLAVPSSPQPGGGTVLAPETIAPVGRTATIRPSGRTTGVLSLIGMGVSVVVGASVWFTHRPAVEPATIATAFGAPEAASSPLRTAPTTASAPSPQAAIVANIALSAAPPASAPVAGVESKPPRHEVPVPVGHGGGVARYSSRSRPLGGFQSVGGVARRPYAPTKPRGRLHPTVRDQCGGPPAIQAGMSVTGKSP
jgi:eukaryotic-like serine/threonine-protein kinase